MAENKVKNSEERKLQERIYSQQCQVCIDVLERRGGQLMLLESLYRMIISREEYGKQLKKKGLSLCQMLSPAHCQRSEILCLCCWVINSKKHWINQSCAQVTFFVLLYRYRCSYNTLLLCFKAFLLPHSVVHCASGLAGLQQCCPLS